MATVEDLDYLNPSMIDDAIQRHLDRLEDADVIARHELEPGERCRDLPNQFYTVTDPARALFDNNLSLSTPGSDSTRPSKSRRGSARSKRCHGPTPTPSETIFRRHLR